MSIQTRLSFRTVKRKHVDQDAAFKLPQPDGKKQATAGRRKKTSLKHYLLPPPVVEAVVTPSIPIPTPSPVSAPLPSTSNLGLVQDPLPVPASTSVSLVPAPTSSMDTKSAPPTPPRNLFPPPNTSADLTLASLIPNLDLPPTSSLPTPVPSDPAPAHNPPTAPPTPPRNLFPPPISPASAKKSALKSRIDPSKNNLTLSPAQLRPAQSPSKTVTFSPGTTSPPPSPLAYRRTKSPRSRRNLAIQNPVGEQQKSPQKSVQKSPQKSVQPSPHKSPQKVSDNGAAGNTLAFSRQQRFAQFFATLPSTTSDSATSTVPSSTGTAASTLTGPTAVAHLEHLLARPPSPYKPLASREGTVKLKSAAALRFPTTSSLPSPSPSPIPSSTMPPLVNKPSLSSISPVSSLPVPSSFPSLPVTRLSLPLHFELLASMFTAVESTLSVLAHRKDGAYGTFPSLKRSVELICKRDFSLKHVAQIITVYPEAYIATLAVITDVNGRETQEVNLAINFNSIPSSVSSDSSTIAPSTATPGSPIKVRSAITGDLLKQRRGEFELRLLARVHHAHREFIKNSPLVGGKDAKEREKWLSIAPADFIGWHSRFDLETAVPPIPLAVLPGEKEREAKRLLLHQQRVDPVSLLYLNTRKVTDTAENSSHGHGNGNGNGSGSSTKNATTTTTTTATSQSIAMLDKNMDIDSYIKAKQQIRAAAMGGGAKFKARENALQRLPDIATRARAKLTQNPRWALPLDMLSQTLFASQTSSHHSGSVDQVKEDLLMLTQLLPRFCSLQESLNKDRVMFCVHKPAGSASASASTSTTTPPNSMSMSEVLKALKQLQQDHAATGDRSQ